MAKRKTRSVEPEKPRDLKILVAIPCHGEPKTQTMVSVVQTMVHFATLPYEGRKDIQIRVVKSPMLAEGRRRLVSAAMDMEATHILWVDSDMKFPTDTLVRLLNHAVAVVAVNYPRKTLEARPTAYISSKDYVGPVWTGENSTGLQEVSVAGMGVMLTDIRVFENMPLPIFQFVPLPPELVKDSGEDVFFCHELSKLGIPVHIDHDLSKQVAHIGDFEYTNFLSKEAEVVKQALYADM